MADSSRSRRTSSENMEDEVSVSADELVVHWGLFCAPVPFLF